MTVGQEVVSTSLSNCDNNSYPWLIRNRLIDKDVKNDTLFLNIGLVLNCCPSPIPELTLRNDTLYIEIEDTSNVSCSCECCFELQINAIGISDTNFVLIHQYETGDFTNQGFADWLEYHELKQYSNKFVLPTPEEINAIGEVNQVNSDDQKIGFWYFYAEDSEQIKYKVYYALNDEGSSVPVWSVSYDSEGEVREVCGIGNDDELVCADVYEYMILFNKKP